MTLPGMDSVDADRSTIGLRDHVDAVVELIDFRARPGQIVLVGHSGGGAIAHAAVDVRPERVARVIYVDCWPLGDGGVINAALPVQNGEIPLPDWSFFDKEDLVDLTTSYGRVSRAGDTDALAGRTGPAAALRPNAVTKYRSPLSRAISRVRSCGTGWRRASRRCKNSPRSATSTTSTYPRAIGRNSPGLRS